MAYDKEEIVGKALKAIEENNITFFDDICLYVEPSRATLYDWELDKLDTIKEALGKNKIRRKKKMRDKWEESDNATLQIAAYKLLAEPEEIERITVSKVQSEQSGPNGGPIQTENRHVVEFHDMSNGDTPKV